MVIGRVLTPQPLSGMAQVGVENVKLPSGLQMAAAGKFLSRLQKLQIGAAPADVYRVAGGLLRVQGFVYRQTIPRLPSEVLSVL